MADREIAPLLDELDALGISDSTLVVFVSDHGEEFGEHGYLSHGQSNFRSVVTVPPSSPAGDYDCDGDSGADDLAEIQSRTGRNCSSVQIENQTWGSLKAIYR